MNDELRYILGDFIEKDPKAAMLIADTYNGLVESASDEAMARLKEKVGANAYKTSGNRIFDLSAETDIDPDKNSGDQDVKDALYIGSTPDLTMPVAPDGTIRDDPDAFEMEWPEDVPDENGVVNNPSEEFADNMMDQIFGDIGNGDDGENLDFSEDGEG